jgi:D-alanine-D-alanine ligase
MKHFDGNFLKNKIVIISDKDDGYTQDEIEHEQKYLQKLAEQMGEYKVDTYYHEVLNPAELRKVLKKYDNKETIIFNWCERFNYQDGTENEVVAVFDKHGFVYTGGPKHLLELVADKHRCVNTLKKSGLPVPDSYLVTKENIDKLDLDFSSKYILKSNKLHGSAGVFMENVVSTYAQLKKVCHRMFKTINTDVLAQQFIHGEEYTVLIWGNDRPEVLPILKINYKDDTKNVYTYTAKFDRESDEYKNSTYSVVSGENHADLVKAIEHITLKAYKSIGMKDYARFDVRKNDDAIYIIDANANPYVNVLGANESCEVYRCSEKLGYNWGETILKLCEYAYKRSRA